MKTFFKKIWNWLRGKTEIDDKAIKKYLEVKETIDELKKEMKDVNMYPVGIQGTKPEENARFHSYLDKLNIGESADVNLPVLTGAATSGTLGNFYVTFSGKLTKTNNGWNFTGTLQMNDTWNFDPDYENKKRPPLAEGLVRFANKYLQGAEFNIESEAVPVTQNNNQPVTTYSSTYEIIPNRVADEKSKKPD